MRRREDIVLFLSTLPVPKSNRYIRRKNGQVFKPARVLHWESRALWEIRNQFDGDGFKKPVSVEVYFFLPDRRKRDIDNMLKTLWDILEKANVIANDNLIFATKTVKVPKSGTSGTVIVIKPFRNPKRVIEEYRLHLEEFKKELSA